MIQDIVDVMEVMFVLRTTVSGCSPFYGGRNMSGEASAAAQVTRGALLHGAAWHDACIEILNLFKPFF